MSRQDLISRTFVALADTLVDDYDLVAFMQELADRCVDILDVADAGIVLRGPGGLQVMASSSERMRLIELLEVQRSEGPCLETWETGRAVAVGQLDQAVDRWPLFAPAALESGYRSVYAAPMRLRTEAVGALNLFGESVDQLDEDGQALAQALADMATIGMLHQRVVQDRQLLTDQLQTALTSRVIIEQAKGVVAEQGKVDMETAFASVRRYARVHNRHLTDVARQIVDRELSAEQLQEAPAPRPQVRRDASPL